MGEAAESAYTLLKELIRVDTTNPPGNEAAAAKVLARFLDTNGIPSRILEKEPGRANLVARLPGPAGAPPLLLSAHLDTVPAQASGWDLPPHSAGEKDGLLYGRGAIDVKNGAAMAAALLVEAKRRGGLKRPLIFAAVADEEVGCALGSRFLAEEHPDLVRGEYFLGEGGGMTQWVMGRKIVPIGVAEKGQLLVRVLFEGPGGHASVPNPEDAAFKLGRFLSRLSDGLPPKVAPPVRVFLSELGKARGGLPGMALKLLRFAPAARLSSWVPPPAGPALRAMLSNTASPTRILAEGAANAIPSAIACDLDIRTLPGCSPAEVLQEIWTATGQTPRHEILREAPAVLSRADTPLFQHLCERTRAHVPDAEPLPYLIPGYTDAKWFSLVATHCYGFLPVLSDDPAEAGRFRTLMHGANERIGKDAFLKGYGLYEDAVLSFLKRPC